MNPTPVVICLCHQRKLWERLPHQQCRKWGVGHLMTPFVRSTAAIKYTSNKKSLEKNRYTQSGSKGQLILKKKFQAIISPKKRSKCILFDTARQFCFEIFWPLVKINKQCTTFCRYYNFNLLRVQFFSGVLLIGIYFSRLGYIAYLKNPFSLAAAAPRS